LKECNAGHSCVPFDAGWNMCIADADLNALMNADTYTTKYGGSTLEGIADATGFPTAATAS